MKSEETKVDPAHIKEQLKKCKTLPTLPGVAVELINQFRKSECSANKSRL